jgi:hypothetical protein
MSKPLGRWVLGLVGCGIAVKSAQQFIQAFRGNFDNRGSLERQARWAVPVARAGLTARGAVFAIIAIFCIVASLKADPSEARGLEGAFTFIQEQPYGPWLLGITGAGFIAFSAYAFVEAVFGRFPVPREVRDALEG